MCWAGWQGRDVTYQDGPPVPLACRSVMKAGDSQHAVPGSVARSHGYLSEVQTSPEPPQNNGIKLWGTAQQSVLISLPGVYQVFEGR